MRVRAIKPLFDRNRHDSQSSFLATFDSPVTHMPPPGSRKKTHPPKPHKAARFRPTPSPWRDSRYHREGERHPRRARRERGRYTGEKSDVRHMCAAVERARPPGCVSLHLKQAISSVHTSLLLALSWFVVVRGEQSESSLFGRGALHTAGTPAGPRMDLLVARTQSFSHDGCKLSPGRMCVLWRHQSLFLLP